MKRWIPAAVALQLACCMCASGQTTPPDWKQLAADYTDTGKAPQVTEVVKDGVGDTIAIHLSFSSADGSVVTGLFIRPKKDGAYPVVLCLHGLGDNKDHIAGLSKTLSNAGAAVLALDVPYHGERKTQATDKLMMTMFMSSMSAKAKGDLMSQMQEVDKEHQFARMYAHMVHEGVLDYRQALDYLATRKDVDMSRIGLVGNSLGSIMGSILAGVDRRVRFEMLGVGGDPALPFAESEPVDFRREYYDACPSLFIGHTTGRPVLMVNGTKDQVINKAATDRLFDAAVEPKTIKWFDCGHTLSAEAINSALDWTVNHFRP